MHKRAREHIGIVIRRKLMRRQRRIINGIPGGCCNYLRCMKMKMVPLYHNKQTSEEYINNERTFRSTCI